MNTLVGISDEWLSNLTITASRDNLKRVTSHITKSQRRSRYRVFL